jgi:xanthine dehydrogenase/oxidase
LDRLKPIKAEHPTAEWPQLIDKAFEKNVDLAATYMYKASDMQEYEIFGTSCCEIEVDLLTGNLQLLRVDIMEDVGESLSPGVDVGQIEGAFVMGLGYWLTESLVYNRESGELLTNRTWNYKPPGTKDIPVDFRVTFLKKSSNPFGVLRSKCNSSLSLKILRVCLLSFSLFSATGEPALCMSIVVIFALRHALNSGRRDSCCELADEYYHLGAPTTIETIFLAANNRQDQYLLK